MNFYQIIEHVRSRDDVINLTTGAPLSNGHITEHIRQCISSLDASTLAHKMWKYADSNGVPELILLFQEYLNHQFHSNLSNDQITTAPGAQAALRYVHEMIEENKKKIFFPFGIEYPGAVKLSREGRHVTGHMDYKNVDQNDYNIFDNIDWQDIGAVVLSNPHNPTSIYFSEHFINALAEEANRHHALLILDETYALPFAPLSLQDYRFIDRDNIVHIYSFSKVGLAAERVSVLIGNQCFIRAFRKILCTSIIQSPKIGQFIAVDLVQFLISNRHITTLLAADYECRFAICKQILTNKDTGNKLYIQPWEGGPFLWLEVFEEEHRDLFEAFLTNGVAIMPGSTFQIRDDQKYKNTFRIGLGESIETLKAGMHKILQTLNL